MSYNFLRAQVSQGLWGESRVGFIFLDPQTRRPRVISTSIREGDSPEFVANTLRDLVRRIENDL
jgi:hypothetical protein